MGKITRFKMIILVGLVLFLARPSLAKDQMILAGDSWALLPCVFNSFQFALSKNRVNVDIPTCYKTSAMQIRADKWMGSKPQKSLQKLLSRSRIKVVYLSLGGNDLISYWHKSMNADQRMQLYLEIKARVQVAIDDIHNRRPDVKVLVSGYDYTRFPSENRRISNYQEIYERTGSPTALEIHQTLIEFTQVMSTLADFKTTFYIHHLGLMHYYYGNPSVGLAPGLTTPPSQISPPQAPNQYGGRPDLEQRRLIMMRVFGLVDSYHLSPTGFALTADHSVRHYLKHWFK